MDTLRRLVGGTTERGLADFEGELACTVFVEEGAIG
jgi:hypothetical protein